MRVAIRWVTHPGWEEYEVETFDEIGPFDSRPRPLEELPRYLNASGYGLFTARPVDPGDQLGPARIINMRHIAEIGPVR